MAMRLLQQHSISINGMECVLQVADRSGQRNKFTASILAEDTRTVLFRASGPSPMDVTDDCVAYLAEKLRKIVSRSQEVTAS